MQSSKDYRVADLGGQVLSFVVEHADTSVLSSSFFGEDERNFLVDCLKTEVAEFSLSVNCRVYARVLCHDNDHVIVKKSEGPPLIGETTKQSSRGEWVVFLHAFSKFTCSWAWIKFAVPLFRKGFNLLFVDLPGFGKSHIGGQVRTSPERWKKLDAVVLANVLAEFSILKARVVSMGEGSEILFNSVKKYRHILGKQHIIYNPLLYPEEDLDALTRMLRVSFSGNLWVCIDKSGYSDASEYKRNFQYFKSLSEDQILHNSVLFTEVTDQDVEPICLCSTMEPGLSSVYSLKPSRYFRVYLTEYLSGTRLPPYAPVMHAPGNMKWKLVSKDEPSTPRMAVGLANTAIKKTSEIFPADPTPNIFKNKHSFGVRLLEFQNREEVEKALSESQKEYQDQYGEDEEKFLEAVEVSKQTYREEEKDDRLNEIREKAKKDEKDNLQHMKDLQKVIEQSIEVDELLHNFSGDEALKKAIEQSKKETNLVEMLAASDEAKSKKKKGK